MMLREEDTGAFKKWVLPKLETISDADAEVLADYVIALVTANESEENVRHNCLESLTDFLQDNTKTFVNDLVQALKTQSYVPPARENGSKTQPFTQKLSKAAQNPASNGTPKLENGARLNKPPTNAPKGPPVIRAPATNHRLPDRPTGPPPVHPLGADEQQMQSSRKRKLVQRGTSETREGQDSHYNQKGPGQRPIKQPTLRGGQGLRAAAPAFEPQNAMPAFRPMPNMFNMANLPPPPPGPFPFDVTNPMFFGMMAALGTNMLGLPLLPPMNVSNNAFTGQSRQGKCFNYHEKGICSRGALCQFEHESQDGPDNGVPEYDPAQPALGTGFASAVSTQRVTQRSHNQKNKGFRQRAEFSLAGRSYDPTNTTLVIELIPEEKFSEEAVRDFFSTFGTITDVQMHAHKRLAIVEFADRAGADQAYNSPKAVFDNRFVKVYWFDKYTGIEEKADHEDREPLDFEAIAAKQAEAQKAFEERQRKVAEADAKAAEIDRQLAEKEAEMKKIKQQIAELTGKGMGGRIAGLSQDLATLQAEAASLFGQTDRDGHPGRGRGDTSHAHFRGRGPPRVRGGHRGSYRGRGGYVPSLAGKVSGVRRLDNRPRRLAVSGIEKGTAKDEALRQYLVNMPECTSIEPHPDEPKTLILTFKERYQAEMFLAASTTSSIPDASPLDLTWIPNDAFGGLAPSSTTPSTITAPSADPNADSDTDSLLDGFNPYDNNRKADNAVKVEEEGEEVEADMDVAEDVDEWL